MTTHSMNSSFKNCDFSNELFNDRETILGGWQISQTTACLKTADGNEPTLQLNTYDNSLTSTHSTNSRLEEDINISKKNCFNQTFW